MHRRSRFTMGIWKPGVQWEDRQLDCIGNQKASVCQKLDIKGVVLKGKRSHIKCYRIAVKRHCQGSQQNKQRPPSCVENKLRCRVLALFASPNREQKVYRNQLQFPHQEKQQHILDGKHCDLTAIHCQYQEVKQLGLQSHWPRC